MKDIIARLRALEAAATPGPWFYTTRFVTEKDCRLIAEMRNSLPKLLAVAEAAKQIQKMPEDAGKIFGLWGALAALEEK